MYKSLLVIVLALFMIQLPAQNLSFKEKGIESIQLQSIKAQLDFLASDWMEGRETGEKGMFLSADYIASIFAMNGVEPFGDTELVYPSREERRKGGKIKKNRTYFQDFNLIRYQPGNEQILNITSRNGNSQTTFKASHRTDFALYGGGPSGLAISGDLVFVGYGISDPDKSYDDFKGIDVKGKIIVRLHGFPGHKDTSSVAYKKFSDQGKAPRNYSSWNKNQTAQKLGAAGVIQLITDNSRWNKNYPLRFDNEFYEGDVPMPRNEWRMELQSDSLFNEPVDIMVTTAVWNHLFENSGVNPEAYEKRAENLSKNNSVILKNKSVDLEYNVKSELIKARNVLAWIPGKDTNRYIVCGAHYDHLGMYNGVIWNGADDNASGTVGVMEMAKAFKNSGQIPEISIVFAAWTGEEKGLLGSSYYVNDALKKKQNLVMNFNFDMISRDSPEDTAGIEIGIGYMKGRNDLKDMVLKNNKDFQLGLKINMRESEGKRGGSDYVPFAVKGVPFLGHYAGWHDDYHMPKDETSKTNYNKLRQIIRLSFANLWDVSTQSVSKEN